MFRRKNNQTNGSSSKERRSHNLSMADDDERSDEHENYCQETTNTTSLVDLESPPTITAPPLSFNDNHEMQSSNLTISAKKFFVRPIQPQDREIIQQLHEEWFPVDYQSEFYDDLVLGKMCHTGEDLYTRVVVDTTTATTTGENDNHRIVACIVAARIPMSRLNRKSRALLLPPNVFGTQRHTSACYIMTLGTIPNYRKLGLATMLVQQCVQDLIVPDETCGALYLHVITSNQGAIRFYEERLGFFQVQEISNYYTIDEEFHNCYLYAKYYHGNWGHLNSFQLLRMWVALLWSQVKGNHGTTTRRLPNHHPDSTAM